MNENLPEVIGKVLLVLCLSLVGAIAGMIVGAIALPVKFLDGNSADTKSAVKQNVADSQQDQI
jgi:hypothetical protein